MTEPMDTPLVVGMGHAARRDEGVGIEVARRVARAVPEARVLTVEGDPSPVLEAWAGAELVYVVEPHRSGDPPGAISRASVTEQEFDRIARRQTAHSAALADAVAMGRSAGRPPRRMIVVGIEGRDFKPGGKLSRPVARVVERVADSLIAELSSRPGGA